MRWSNVDPKRKWHLWFAWKPVIVGDEEVWLETIERRYIGGGMYDYTNTKRGLSQ